MNTEIRNWYLLGMIFVLSVIMIFGCSSDKGGEKVNSEEAQGEKMADTESGEKKNTLLDPWTYNGAPVTLKMMIWIDDETFRIRYKEKIEEIFPEITLELISGGDSEEQLQELFAKGIMPDIHIGKPRADLVKTLDFLEPIDDYIEKSGFDLSIFQKGIVENLRAGDPTGEGHLYGLPVENSVRTMFYNKDIFDLFGEPYPEDGLTWNEVLEIAGRLTQERNGIQYRGLAIDPGAMPFMQLSVGGTDAETGEILFANDPNTKKFFDLIDKYRNIPNIVNASDTPDGFHDGPRNIAMSILNAPWFELLTREEGFNFDMVTVPTWEELPDIAPTWGALPLNITKHSEHKDAAWSVVAFLASEEGQIHLSQAGSPPVIDSQTAFEQFTANSTKDLDQTFNSTAPFTQTLAELPPYSRYDEPFFDFMNTKGEEFLTSDQDVVTYIREMGEEYAGIVEEIKAQQ
ncbi:extracellular solute-binding protein [Bacillus sp. SD088]|uniref:extracellular solute-binding protein n=1 Tax=Bacillus sp. SD088 TaxID=2782012 RepID=UPI001A95696B|nr:extracellular solute-binding protein [Bacillus sp. SD088]MBO0991759.1 extracellular solute-binding protein [Bacillus sp. SD088]